jgi:hypothetical protein
MKNATEFRLVVEGKKTGRKYFSIFLSLRALLNAPKRWPVV